MIDAIKSNLENIFSPTFVDVIDESALHKGHIGFAGENIVSHIKITIKAKSLSSMNRIDAHKVIYKAINEITRSLHAITIEIKK